MPRAYPVVHSKFVNLTVPLKSIVKAAASDDEVSLAGFGKFKVKASPEREGRNPANGEKIKIAASKKLSFSPAKAVKDVLNA